jgi:hypothetical protein
MELIKITQCNKSLSFNSTNSLAKSLVPTSFSKVLLNGFAHPDTSLVINYSPTDCEFLVLFKSLHPDLSFVEICEFSKNLSIIPGFENFTSHEVFANYAYKFDALLKQSIELSSDLPTDFLHWCTQKKWGPQDFAPLRSLSSEQIIELHPYFIKIKDPCSKSEGTQIFELLIELFLLNKNISLLLQLDINQWPAYLKKERYPATHTQQQKNEDLVQKINWPLHSQAKWIRRGDKSGIELKLFFSHPQELSRSLIKLEQVKSYFETDSTGKQLWSID